MRVAIVTGATSGIGQGAALALAADGWDVVASGRDRERGGDLERELGERGTFVAGDISDEGAIGSLVDAARARGDLRCLVHSAGIHFLASTPETDPAEWDRLMTVNLRAAFLLARAAIPVMRDRGGGVVVNVSSEAGLAAIPNQVAYNVSKAALLMLTRSIAVDHGAEGIRAVSICPGTTRTPLVDAAIASAPDPAAHERWLASSRPARRLGEVNEIARAIVFAAGDDCAFMTGSELVIDGGYTAA